MTIEYLRTLFNRDLSRLKTEIQAYRSEENLWRVEKSIANSAGNLCLHLVGNLQTFIGAELGGTSYIRKRDLEFSLKNVPRRDLIEQIEETKTIVDQALHRLTQEKLREEYPLLIYEEKTSTEFLLISLVAHLTYHLGQVNYHRRLLDH